MACCFQDLFSIYRLPTIYIYIFVNLYIYIYIYIYNKDGFGSKTPTKVGMPTKTKTKPISNQFHSVMNILEILLLTINVFGGARGVMVIEFKSWTRLITFT